MKDTFLAAAEVFTIGIVQSFYTAYADDARDERIKRSHELIAVFAEMFSAQLCDASSCADQGCASLIGRNNLRYGCDTTSSGSCACLPPVVTSPAQTVASAEVAGE